MKIWMLVIFAVILIAFSLSPLRYRAFAAQPVYLDLGEVSRSNSFPRGQCTWYAYERSLDAGTPLHFSQSYGRNAKDWPKLAIGGKLSQTPKPGRIMILDGWKGNPYGHVGYVEAVDDEDHWTISHANFKVGNEYARMDSVSVRKVDCIRTSTRTIKFADGHAEFPLLGFMAP